MSAGVQTKPENPVVAAVIDHCRKNALVAARQLLGNEERVEGDRYYWRAPYRADNNPGFEVRAADGRCFDGRECVGDLMDVYQKTHGITDLATACEEMAPVLGLTFAPPAPPARPRPVDAGAALENFERGLSDFKEKSKQAEWKNGPWIYRDAAGNNVLKVVRINKGKPDENGKYEKDFPQYHFSDGEWKSGRGGMETTPLYNLQEILNHPTWPVMIHEGEKACGAGERLFTGIECVHTTWAQGADAWPTGEWEVLKGRTAYLAPDNDPADEDFPDGKSQTRMRDLGDYLQSLGSTVYDIPLPAGMPVKGDAFEALESGMNGAEIFKSAVLRSGSVNHGLKCKPSTDICATDYPDLQWIVKDVCLKGWQYYQPRQR